MVKTARAKVSRMRGPTVASVNTPLPTLAPPSKRSITSKEASDEEEDVVIVEPRNKKARKTSTLTSKTTGPSTSSKVSSNNCATKIQTETIRPAILLPTNLTNYRMFPIKFNHLTSPQFKNSWCKNGGINISHEYSHMIELRLKQLSADIQNSNSSNSHYDYTAEVERLYRKGGNKTPTKIKKTMSIKMQFQPPFTFLLSNVVRLYQEYTVNLPPFLLLKQNLEDVDSTGL